MATYARKSSARATTAVYSATSWTSALAPVAGAPTETVSATAPEPR